MVKKYLVRLTEEERAGLEGVVKKGKGAAYRIKHAHILLAVDAEGPNGPDRKAAQAYRCHVHTVENVRRRLVEHGLEAALGRKAQVRPSRERILDGEKEARLVCIACSEPPEGRARWTLQMLADELVALKVVDSVSEPTVRRALKKTNSNRTWASVGSFRPDTTRIS
jgi:transposase